MGDAMSGTMQCEIREGVATLRFNRPDAGNSLDMELACALRDAARRVTDDPAVRVVVLTGTGRLFCAGGDVTAMAKAGDAEAYLLELAGTAHEACKALAHMQKPLICAVNGPAAGAGLPLAVMGDVVIAARSAHFTTAYSGIGLTPDGGTSFLLPRLVGLRKAQEMVLLNQRVGAEEAAAIGLVTRVVDDEALIEDVGAVAARLVAAPVAALGAARAMLLDSYYTPYDAMLDREAKGIARAAGRAEGREGVAAFSEKRRPDFTIR